MTDQSTLWRTRYARQISLPNWGEAGQHALANKTVMIIGLGGLGSPVATYLAASGVGTLKLNDFDSVDLSNLPRQPLHSSEDVNRLKVESAQERLRAINPLVDYKPLPSRLTETELRDALSDCHCVVDCTDNFGSRFAINRAAIATGTPLVSAAAIREEGQLAVFRHDVSDSPCYRCLYAESDEATGDCQGQGVMSPLVGVVGSMAATAVLNILVYNDNNAGSLLLFDARRLQWRAITLRKDPHCPACSEGGQT
ncbi:MAG: HesA/MoeB/ThiF family protein [Pseudomonadota bacterium]